MAEKVYLKPNTSKVKPVLVRDPLTFKELPEEGAYVDMSNHVRRMHFTTLLRRGDVMKAKPPAPDKKATPKAKEASE
jgi:hypothetical protein